MQYQQMHNELHSERILFCKPLHIQNRYKKVRKQKIQDVNTFTTYLMLSEQKKRTGIVPMPLIDYNGTAITLYQ